VWCSEDVCGGVYGCVCGGVYGCVCGCVLYVCCVCVRERERERERERIVYVWCVCVCERETRERERVWRYGEYVRSGTHTHTLSVTLRNYTQMESSLVFVQQQRA